MANVTLNVSSNQNITYNIDGATTSITVQLNGASGNVVSLAGTTRCTVSGTSPYPSGTLVTISGFTRSSTYTAIFACTVGSGTASTTYTVVLSGSVAALNTYSITAPASINEGSAGTINVASNVNGTYYWTVEPSGDFGTSSGSVSISSGTGSFTVTPSADVTSEGPETATVRLRSGSTSGTILASDTFTINDTSYPTGGGGSYSVSFSSNNQYRYADVYSTETVSANISSSWSTYYITTSNLPTGASVNPGSTNPGGSLLYSFTNVAKDDDGQYYEIYVDGNGGSTAGRSYLRVYVYNTITTANGSLSAPTNDINSTATITFSRSSAGSNGSSGDQYMWSTSATMPAYNDAGWATLGSSATLASVPRGETRYLHIQRWTYRQGSTTLVGKRETRTLSHTVGWPDANQFVLSYCSDYNTYYRYTDGSGGTYDSLISYNSCDGYNATPSAFTLNDVSNKEKDTSYTSNEITVAGLVIRSGESVAASCNAGTLYKNGVAVSGNSTTAVNGDKFKIALTSSSSYSTAVSSTLNIGGRTESYIVTTRAQDTTPSAFSFTDVTGANRGSLITAANTITIAGMDSDASVTASITGSTGKQFRWRSSSSATWSAWTATSKTGVTNGYQFEIRVYASSSFNTGTSATLTVGGVSDTFNVQSEVSVSPDTSVTITTNTPLYGATSFTMSLSGGGSTTTYQVRSGSYTGTILKTFTGNITNTTVNSTPALDPGTTYYVTAYVSDANDGTEVVSNVKTFTVIRAAAVSPDTAVTIIPAGNIQLLSSDTDATKSISNANSNGVTDYQLIHGTTVDDSYTSTGTSFDLVIDTLPTSATSYKIQARVPTADGGNNTWTDVETFTVTPADTTPASTAFTNITDAVASTVFKQSFTITGITESVTLSSNGSVTFATSENGTYGNITVSNNGTYWAKMTSSATAGGSVSGTIANRTWTITTVDPATAPATSTYNISVSGGYNTSRDVIVGDSVNATFSSFGTYGQIYKDTSAPNLNADNIVLDPTSTGATGTINLSFPSTVTNSNAGTSYKIYFKNPVTNIQGSVSGKVYTAPVSGTGSWSNTSDTTTVAATFNATFSATVGSGSGAAEYCITESSTAPAIGDAAWTSFTSNIVNATKTVTRGHTYYLHIQRILNVSGVIYRRSTPNSYSSGTIPYVPTASNATVNNFYITSTATSATATVNSVNSTQYYYGYSGTTRYPTTDASTTNYGKLVMPSASLPAKGERTLFSLYTLRKAAQGGQIGDANYVDTTDDFYILRRQDTPSITVTEKSSTSTTVTYTVRITHNGGTYTFFDFSDNNGTSYATSVAANANNYAEVDYTLTRGGASATFRGRVRNGTIVYSDTVAGGTYSAAITAPTDISFSGHTNNTTATEYIDITATGSGGLGGTLKVADSDYANEASWSTNGATFSVKRGTAPTFYAKRFGTVSNSTTYSEAVPTIPYVLPTSATVTAATTLAWGSSSYSVQISNYVDGHSYLLEYQAADGTWPDIYTFTGNATRTTFTAAQLPAAAAGSTLNYRIRKKRSVEAGGDNGFDAMSSWTVTRENEPVSAPTDIQFGTAASTASPETTITVTGSGGSGGTLKVADSDYASEASWKANGSTFTVARGDTPTFYAKRFGDGANSSTYSEAHPGIPYLLPDADVTVTGSPFTAGQNTTSLNIAISDVESDERVRVKLGTTYWTATQDDDQTISVATPEAGGSATYTVQNRRNTDTGGDGSTWYDTDTTFVINRTANALPVISTFTASPAAPIGAVTVTLSANASDDTLGTIKTFVIEQHSGTTVALGTQTTTGIDTQTASVSTTFTSPNETGTLVFKAIATDDDDGEAVYYLTVNTNVDGGVVTPPTGDGYGLEVFGPDGTTSYLRITDRITSILAYLSGTLSNTNTSDSYTVPGLRNILWDGAASTSYNQTPRVSISGDVITITRAPGVTGTVNYYFIVCGD